MHTGFLTGGGGVVRRYTCGVLMALVIVGYVISILTSNVFFYILSFTTLIAAILLIMLSLGLNFIWRFLPTDFRKKREKSHFKKSILWSVVLFFLLAGIIDWLCLPHPSPLFHRIGSIATLVFAAFCACSLINHYKRKTIIAGTVVFVLFTALLSGVSYAAMRISFGALLSGKSSTKSVDNLLSLGYVDWVPSAEDTKNAESVVYYHPTLAFEGVNMYQSRMLPEAYLMDMHGNILHKWARKVENCDNWAFHAELCENGDLLVAANTHLIRLDWSSNIKWTKRIGAHHDVAIGKNGDLYVPVCKRKLVFWHGIPVPIVYHQIVALSSEGKIRKKVCVYEMVKEHIPLSKITKPYVGMLKLLKPKNMLILCKNILTSFRLDTGSILGGETHFDIIHLNSIEIMDKNIEGFCRKGDWLISMRELDLIGIVDTKNEKFTWSWGPGELDMQHHPTLLENGNVLIFDNGWRRGFSRIVELNPLTKKIVWEYKSDPPQQFFTYNKGGNQRLPNGNTLITESNEGRVFEITKDGKVVWEFYNPDVKKEEKERAGIYRMMRITNPERYTHLNEFE